MRKYIEIAVVAVAVLAIVNRVPALRSAIMG